MPRSAGHFRSSTHLCCFSLLIDRRLCDLSQRLVGGLFLFERFLQERDCIFETKLFGPGYQRPIAGNLVVLDGLRGGKKSGVQRRRVLVRAMLNKPEVANCQLAVKMPWPSRSFRGSSSDNLVTGPPACSP